MLSSILYQQLLGLICHVSSYYHTRSHRQRMLLTALVILPLFLFLITACGSKGGGPIKGK
jgi:hypothetical protein